MNLVVHRSGPSGFGFATGRAHAHDGHRWWRASLGLLALLCACLPGCRQEAYQRIPPKLKGCLIPTAALTDDLRFQKSGITDGEFWMAEGEEVRIILKEFSFQIAPGGDPARMQTCTVNPSAPETHCSGSSGAAFAGHYQVTVVKCPGQAMCQTGTVMATCTFQDSPGGGQPAMPAQGDSCNFIRADKEDATYHLVPALVFTDSSGNVIQTLQGEMTAPLKARIPAMSNAVIDYDLGPATHEIWGFTILDRTPMAPSDEDCVTPPPAAGSAPVPVKWEESFAPSVRVASVSVTQEQRADTSSAYHSVPIPMCGMNAGGLYCPSNCGDGTQPCPSPSVDVSACMTHSFATPAYVSAQPLHLAEWNPIFGVDTPVACHIGTVRKDQPIGDLAKAPVIHFQLEVKP